MVEEIDLLVNEYGVRNIKFADEMFVLNQRHVIGICDLLIERGYDLNIWAYARVDTVKDNMLDKLKRAGFNWLALGIEAADDRVLTDVDKRYEVERGLRHGPPHQGRRHQHHRQLHLRPARRHARDDAAHARPGARSQLRVRQLLLGDGVSGLAAVRRGDASRMAAAGRLERLFAACRRHASAADRHISAGDVLRFRDQAFDTYFRHEPYLQMVQRKFGEGTLAHIREMTAHKLERKYAKQP